MKKILLSILGILLVFPLAAYAFNDSFGHLNKEAIDYLEEKDVVHGYGDGTYRPDNEINRAEFLKIILESLNIELNASGYCFPDVQSDWYAPYVCKAKSIGIVSGYPDGYFRPANNINLVEALKIILEAYDSFLNYDYSQWYEPYYYFMQNNELLARVSTSISHEITRGEMAQLIYNLDNFYDNELTPEPEPSPEPEPTLEPERSILSPSSQQIGICETLLNNGQPEDKIDIVFIPDGGISFSEYKSFLEKIFTENYNESNFLNTPPFSTNLNQFNFYSVWKTEDYQCANGNFDCDVKTRVLASQCPIISAYDGMVRVTEGSLNVVGTFGDKSESCKSTETGEFVNYTLSSGESVSVNYCHGQVLTNVTTSTEDVLHELGHMVGDLPHPERNTIMAYPPYYGDKFDQIEIDQLCTKISEASNITKSQCINNAN